MNRSFNNNTEQRAKAPTTNYAQAAAAKTQPPQARGHQPQQPNTDLEPPYMKPPYKSGPYHNRNSNSYHNKSNNTYNNNRKAPVQLPMAPPTDTAPIQFGSINQSKAEAETHTMNDTATTYRPQSRPPQKEIPRSPRTTQDGRLFTQPYAPRRDYHPSGGDSYSNHHHNNINNNNNSSSSSSNSRYYNNNTSNHRGYNTSNNNRPPPSQQYSPNHQYLHYSPNHQHQLPPSPMSHGTSPNFSPSTKKSPHLVPPSPQPTTTATGAAPAWSGQFYYPPYSVVPSYTLQQPQASPIVPPTTTRKVIAIIDPATGTALNTNPISLHAQTTTTTTTTVKDTHHHHHLDFVKAPHVSKAVSIVDPAIRDRELREKREREEEEERKKQEEEKARLEAERLEAERLEAERLEAERLEAERLEAEKKRLEEAAAEKKRLEQEAIETERLRQEAIAAAALAKAQEELERKLAEERESKRVISELEAEKKSRQVNGKVKMIDDIGSVQYPANLAHVPKAGEKHTYSIEFLLQFQQLCLDTNEDVLAIISKEMGDNNSSNNTTSRSNSMRQPSDRGKGSRSTGGNDMFRMGSSGRMEMGKFNMGRPLTARPPQQQQQQQMERQQSSHHGRGGSNMINRGRGGSGMKITRPQHPSQQGAPTIPMDQVVPLEKSENRWVPTLQNAAAPKEGELMSQEYITRKVNALLNKLTVEKFDSIAPQIFAYAHQSAKEEDGRSLRTVMKLTFEKACDEPAFASMWARLCRSMYDAMTDEIRDTSILDDEEKPSCGILLFRKYLFNRCQVEFEKGWKVNMPEVEEDMMTEEYYIAAKAKRQGLGLIQFIGELFKLEMLSERIMYSCMVKLCNNPLEAGDEEAESLCKLLATIGKVLDAKPKTEKWVDVVIKRMREEMIKSPKLSSRIRFMIQDLFDLRKDKWVPRIGGNQVGPTTIAKIHEMAEKAKEEKEALKRNNSSRGQYIPNNNQYNNTRTGSYRQKDYHSQVGQDGWSTVAQGASKTRVTNDLSNFGKTDRSRPRTNILGPSNSPFPSLTRGKSVTNIDTKNVTTTNDGRSSPATNMFSALLSDDQQQRKKLQLTPRATEAKEKLSEEEAKRKCKNILEEYFNIRDKKELVECVKELDDPDYLQALITEMLTVVEKKAQDVENMCETMVFLNSEQLLSKEHYVKAFKQFMEGYDDLTIDVPQAPTYVAQLLKAASVNPQEVGGDDHISLQKAYQRL